EVLDLAVARSLYPTWVLRRVLRHHHRGLGVERVHLEAGAVVHARVDGAPDRRQALGGGVALHDLEQRLRRLLVLRLEETEERQLLVVHPDVRVVAHVRHPAHHATVALGQVERLLGVPPERVLLLVEHLELRDAQGRHPVGVALVLGVRIVDEGSYPGPVLRLLDRELPHGGPQMTPSRLPTKANADRSRSSCSAVWLALTLVRMIDWPLGTPGGRAGVVKTPSSHRPFQKAMAS